MKTRLLPPLLLLALVLFPGCSKKEYDISDGINQEMTLFEDEITLPLGNAGPITVKSLLESSPSLAALFENLVKEGDDGNYFFEVADVIFTESAFKLAMEIPDPTQPYRWELGDKSTFIASLAGALQPLGIVFPHQMLIIQARDPLWSQLGVHTRARVICRDSAYRETYVQEIDLSNITLDVRGIVETIAQFDFPADLVDIVDQVTLKNLAIDIPANMQDLIRSTGEEYFVFSTKFKSQVALSEKFDYTFSFPIHFDLPASRYWLHRIELSFETVSTFPLDITVKSAQALGPDDAMIPGVAITAGTTIAGGTPDVPGVSSITLAMEATDGIIPDLRGVKLELHLKSPEELGAVPLSSSMGLSIQSASAKLDGGITLFRDE